MFHMSGQEGVFFIGSRNQGLKTPHYLTVLEHAGIGERLNVCLPG